MNNTTKLDKLRERLTAAQHEFEQEFDRLLKEKRQQFSYTMHRGRVIFEHQVRLWQHQQRIGVWSYLKRAPLVALHDPQLNRL